MNINLELYKIFLNVAEQKNITKAAKKLMISQPGVSKSIKNLEEQLNCKLFVRTKSGVYLTKEGKMLYSKLTDAIEIIDNAEKSLMEMINMTNGYINIGISNTLTRNFLLKYIEEFHKQYPQIKIKIYTNPTDELIIKARNGIIDFIILNLPYEVPNDFTTKNLKTIQDCFVANSNYDYLKKETIPLENINNYPLILMAKGSNTRYFLDNFCLSHNITLIPEMELASYSLVTHFAKIGLGIGLVTKNFIAKELNNGELFELNIVPKLNERHIGLIYLKNKSLSYSAQKFLQLLKKEKA